jgi:hypothetical protein
MSATYSLVGMYSRSISLPFDLLVWKTVPHFNVTVFGAIMELGIPCDSNRGLVVDARRGEK